MNDSTLWLRITRGKRTTLYKVLALPVDPAVALLAWRLVKTNGEQYTVSVGRHGPECDCADAVYRQRSSYGEQCKHVASLQEQGLLRPLRVSRKETVNQ